MDLKLTGKSAIVCASSKGLGKACALALAKEGVNVWISARHKDALNAAASEIAAAGGGKARTVIADVTTAEGRDALFAACPKPDIVVNNAGGPPPGDFRDWGQQEWFDAINGNMYSAIDMIRRSLDGMIERRFGRIVNITSVAVKLPQAELGLSNGARCGLTGFIAGIAREPSQHNVTINNLLNYLNQLDKLVLDERTVLRGRARASSPRPSRRPWWDARRGRARARDRRRVPARRA